MSPSSASSSSAIDVLLVENNPLDAGLAMRALAKFNLADRLAWIRDGAEAIDRIFGSSGNPDAAVIHCPKLVLLALELPTVEGHEVLRRLKADARTQHIPVVVVTSSREDHDLERAYRSGANGYVVKPTSFDSFVAAIHEVGLYWLFLNRSFDPGSRRAPASASSGRETSSPASQHVNALIVEDSVADTNLIVGELERQGFAVTWRSVDSAAAMRSALMDHRWDIVLSDHSIRNFSSLAALGVLHACGSDLPMIVIARAMELESAAAAMRAGAHDIVHMDRVDGLGSAITRSMSEAAERRRRTAAEDALRDNGALLDAIVAGTTDAVYAKDVVGRYFFLNAAMEHAIGKRADEMLGRDDSFLFPPLEAAAARERDRAILASGVATTCEEVLTIADGRKATYLSTMGPLFDAGGRTVGLFGVARDITVRKQAEGRLHHFAQLCELLPVAITVHDARGSFLYANQRACDSHGYSRDELLSLTAHELFVAEDETLREEVARSIAATGEACFHAEHVRRDGTSFPVDVHVRASHWNGAEVLLTVAIDVTRSPTAEVGQPTMAPHFRQAQKMERVGHLADAISDELNMMLAVTLRTLDMTTSILQVEHPVSADMEEIHQAGERATALAQQLLAVTREPVIVPLANRIERPDRQVSGHVGAANR